MQLPAGRWAGFSGEWLCETCPFCGANWRLFWNVYSNLGFCQSGSCQTAIVGLQAFEGAFAGRLIDAGIVSRRAHRRANTGLDTPNLRFQNAWDNDTARNYLIGRNVTESESRAIPIYWIAERSAIAIDMYPSSPEYPVEVLYRPLNWKDSKWISISGVSKSMYVWGFEYWKLNPKPYIIITEGVFDLLSPGLLGHGIAVLGSEMSSSVGALFHGLNALPIIWTDADAAGKKARQVIKEMLRSWGVESECLTSKKDPKEYTRDQAIKLMDGIKDFALQ